jgi:hypothetical protein
MCVCYGLGRLGVAVGSVRSVSSVVGLRGPGLPCALLSLCRLSSGVSSVCLCAVRSLGPLGPVCTLENRCMYVCTVTIPSMLLTTTYIGYCNRERERKDYYHEWNWR